MLYSEKLKSFEAAHPCAFMTVEGADFRYVLSGKGNARTLVLLNGGMSVKDFCGYVAAQFIGAIAGAWALLLVLGDSYGLGANHIYGAPDAPSLKISLVIEAVLTFVFVLSVLGATSKKENSHLAGIVIGLSLTLVHLLGIPFTGTSVNPARSFGPALLLGGESLKCVWVFIVAPLVGGAAAALVWRFLNPAKKD